MGWRRAGRLVIAASLLRIQQSAPGRCAARRRVLLARVGGAARCRRSQPRRSQRCMAQGRHSTQRPFALVHWQVSIAWVPIRMCGGGTVDLGLALPRSGLCDRQGWCIWRYRWSHGISNNLGSRRSRQLENLPHVQQCDIRKVRRMCTAGRPPLGRRASTNIGELRISCTLFAGILYTAGALHRAAVSAL